MPQALPFGLSRDVVEKLKTVFRKHSNIQEIKIYGSRAKGNFRPGSDIDIVLFAPSMQTTELLKIENEIDDLLLAYKVDLSLFHQIDNPDLIDDIQRVGLVFDFFGQ